MSGAKLIGGRHHGRSYAAGVLHLAVSEKAREEFREALRKQSELFMMPTVPAYDIVYAPRSRYWQRRELYWHRKDRKLARRARAMRERLERAAGPLFEVIEHPPVIRAL